MATKPHGHGDIHFLLHSSGTAQRWANLTLILTLALTLALALTLTLTPTWPSGSPAAAAS